jgi:2-polyprenyl-6-methoxyphenol hydroxylase-like FAD-dependent oxidoreductase
LQGGQQVLSSLYPGFTGELRRLGATQAIVGRDIVWYLPDGKAYNPVGSLRAPLDLGFEAHCASRGLIEFLIRRLTLALPNVKLETGATVRELAHNGGRVQGVRCSDSRSFAAELVVDAGGRGSHAPRWLEAMGFARPSETTIGVDTAYSTANFRRPKSYTGEPLIFVTGPAPYFTRRGYLITIENETLLVSLIGRFGDYPSTDKSGFRDFAKELHSPFISELIGGAEQLTQINHYRFPTSVQRHFERMASFPEGFLILGDAVCSFNPIYAQGMSAAALQVQVLQQILRDRAAASQGLEGLALAFFPKAAEVIVTPWILAANFDFAYPQTRGVRPPDLGEGARYLAAVGALTAEDVEACRLMVEVFQLTKPLSVLREEPLRSRVLERIRKQTAK